jgi:hypothetical protein
MARQEKAARREIKMSKEISATKYPHPSRRQVLRTAGLAIGAAATAQLGMTGARAAGYPDRPIKIIVPFAPAGPTDIMARDPRRKILVRLLGGNVIVENRSGAGGNIGIGYAAHAEPDGYTLLGHLERLCRQSKPLREFPTIPSRISRRSPNSAPRRM